MFTRIISTHALGVYATTAPRDACTWWTCTVPLNIAPRVVRIYVSCPPIYRTTRRVHSYLPLVGVFVTLPHSHVFPPPLVGVFVTLPPSHVSPPCRRPRHAPPFTRIPPPLVGVFVTLPPSHVSPPCRRPRHAPPFTRIPPSPCRRLRHAPPLSASSSRSPIPTYLPLVSCLRCLINIQLPPPVLLTQPHNTYCYDSEDRHDEVGGEGRGG